MKAIILASGKGTRLKPLTNTIPKPLIKVMGISILEHNLNNLYKSVNEIIIVVKYKKEIFFEEIGYEYKGVKIIYHIQGKLKGTGAAITGIDIDDDVIILNGDSLFDKKDINKILNLKGFGCLVKEVSVPEKYGIFKQDKNGFAEKIIEKPNHFIGNLANLGVYKFNKKIFKISENIKVSIRGEYEITDSINEFCKDEKFKLINIEGEFIDIGVCSDILIANNIFLNRLKKSTIKGTIEEGVTIKGNIILEKGAILKSGTYIEGNIYIGKDTHIGPNTYLRGGTVIGKNCKIGNAVEVKNSNIGDSVKIPNMSYLGDSILGNNINISSGFISENINKNEETIKVMINGKLINSERRKFGVIIGDNVKTSINTCCLPGRIIENNTYTSPGEIIK